MDAKIVENKEKQKKAPLWSEDDNYIGREAPKYNALSRFSRILGTRLQCAEMFLEFV